MRPELTPEELYKSAMRMRLTRAGLLRIMKENEQRDADKQAKLAENRDELS